MLTSLRAASAKIDEAARLLANPKKIEDAREGFRLTQAAAVDQANAQRIAKDLGISGCRFA